MPAAGSQTVSSGPGWTQSTMALISSRGVKYCPAHSRLLAEFFQHVPVVQFECLAV